MPQPHFYKHLDEQGNCNVNINLNMKQIAEMVNSANYGLHRFLSETIDIKKRSEYEDERKFADELEQLLRRGYF